MLIIGIDPGINGAICLFKDGKIVDVFEMPKMAVGKKNKSQVNASQIFNEIQKAIEGEDKTKDYTKIWNEFLEDAGKYYKEQIREINNEPNKVAVYIYDDFWDVLNKRGRRKIETIHLDGKEVEILDYIRSFLKPETKELFEELGIPYKLNILFEGLPGTGKTSLIYTIASELNRDVAILNFNKDVDDNVFMRALRRLPKNVIFVLEDIDVLFKERKENDNFKSMISFSGLLNSLDGMAFKDDLITIMTTNYKIHLIIGGRGSEKAFLEKLVKKVGCQEEISIIGFIPEKKSKIKFNIYHDDK